MQNRKTISALFAVLIISSLFGITALSAKTTTPDPITLIWDEISSIWDAITSLQDKDSELETKIDAITPTEGSLKFTAPDFGFKGTRIHNTFYETSTEGWLVAPVHLPQGAKITGITLIADDKGPGGVIWRDHVSLNLYIVDYGSLTGDEYPIVNNVASLDSEVTPAGKYYGNYYSETRDMAQAMHWDIVDNDKASYFLYLWVPYPISDANHYFTFYSASIEYEIP